MSAIRAIVAILAIPAMTILCGTVAAAGGQEPAGGGPAPGKWQFTGKDNTGTVWTGTLSIEKLDPARFDPKRYHSLCSLEVESSDRSKGTRGVEAPCSWDPRTRAVSFSTGYTVIHLYTGVLAPDGRSLTQGKWTESKKGSGASGETIVRSGTWAAKLPAR